MALLESLPDVAGLIARKAWTSAVTAGATQIAQLALIDSVPGAVWAPGGTPQVVFGFTVRNGKVVEIELAADTERLSRLQIEILP